MSQVDCIKIVTFQNGKAFSYEITGEKFIDKPADLSRQFVDGITVSLPPISGNVERGKFKQLFSTNIPKLPPGKYYLKWSATYKVNPIRDITVVAKSACFEVD